MNAMNQIDPNQIRQCRTIRDYLAITGAGSVEDLTDDQVVAWIKAGKTDAETENGLWTVEHGAVGHMPDRTKAFRLIRTAIKTGQHFVCCFVQNEGVVDDPDGNAGPDAGSVFMGLTDPGSVTTTAAGAVIPSVTSDCFDCRWINPDGRTCAAFPAGIPDAILTGMKGHRSVDVRQITDIVFERRDPVR